MRDFKFTESERPTMENFNQRFQSIADLANGLGNEYVWLRNDGTYVNSPDHNAYPPAVSDGFTYTLLGQFANLGAKIATGSYTGTGTYGSSNPNSLTFDFEPKLILIPLHTGSDSYGLWYQSLVPKDNYYTIIPFSNVPTEYTRGAGFGVTSSDVFGKKAGNTLYWYNTSSAYNQFNAAATDYYWVAIG